MDKTILKEKSVSKIKQYFIERNDIVKTVKLKQYRGSSWQTMTLEEITLINQLYFKGMFDYDSLPLNRKIELLNDEYMLFGEMEIQTNSEYTLVIFNSGSTYEYYIIKESLNLQLIKQKVMEELELSDEDSFQLFLKLF
jgi:hypothetical protein